MKQAEFTEISNPQIFSWQIKEK